MIVTLPRQITVPDDTPIVEFIAKAQALGLRVVSIPKGNGLNLGPKNPPKSGAHDNARR